MQRKSSSSVRIYYPKFDKAELIQKLNEKIQILRKRLPLMLVVLFGSYAKENYTAFSDIDLLVVYEGEERADAFAIVKKTSSIPLLEPHVYSKREYEEMKETVHGMIKDGIILFQRSSGCHSSEGWNPEY